jgi:hypothetical protein
MARLHRQIVMFEHIYREQNTEADSVANQGHGKQFTFCDFASRGQYYREQFDGSRYNEGSSAVGFRIWASSSLPCELLDQASWEVARESSGALEETSIVQCELIACVLAFQALTCIVMQRERDMYGGLNLAKLSLDSVTFWFQAWGKCSSWSSLVLLPVVRSLSAVAVCPCSSSPSACSLLLVSSVFVVLCPVRISVEPATISRLVSCLCVCLVFVVSVGLPSLGRCVFALVPVVSCLAGPVSFVVPCWFCCVCCG